jgi:hypothetical protein
MVVSCGDWNYCGGFVVAEFRLECSSLELGREEVIYDTLGGILQVYDKSSYFIGVFFYL